MHEMLFKIILKLLFFSIPRDQKTFFFLFFVQIKYQIFDVILRLKCMHISFVHNTCATCNFHLKIQAKKNIIASHWHSFFFLQFLNNSVCTTSQTEKKKFQRFIVNKKSTKWFVLFEQWQNKRCLYVAFCRPCCVL